MGPLAGLRIVEIVGIGPGPFAAMMLADMGADVLRIDRVDRARTGGPYARPELDVLNRGRPNAAVDLKRPEGVELLLRLLERSDALIEGFRPGVMERLGLGPEPCLERNPRLVYGRMTGWGQDGPLARSVGHDLNYLALSGTLSAIGRAGQPPVPPLNLVCDFGGGGMLLAYGITCALIERGRSGRGQVVDAAMLDGAAVLSASLHGMQQSGFQFERGTNLLDGGAPDYDVYETADGRFVSIASLEPQFHAALLEVLGLDAAEMPHPLDRSAWPATKARFARIFKTRTRDEWCRAFEGRDVCFAPVLELDEARDHEHNRAREVFVDVEGTRQPAPAPRFSRTPGRVRGPAVEAGHDTDDALADWGLDAAEIHSLRDEGVIA
ncbi:MAG: CaiB/BaiF CoA transferase family protein [Myxococcota bacterium]